MIAAKVQNDNDAVAEWGRRRRVWEKGSKYEATGERQEEEVVVDEVGEEEAGYDDDNA